MNDTVFTAKPKKKMLHASFRSTNLLNLPVYHCLRSIMPKRIAQNRVPLSNISMISLATGIPLGSKTGMLSSLYWGLVSMYLVFLVNLGQNNSKSS